MAFTSDIKLQLYNIKTNKLEFVTKDGVRHYYMLTTIKKS